MPTTADATLRLSLGPRVDAVLVQPITPRPSPWSAEDGFEEFERFLGVLGGIVDDGGLAVLTAGMNAYGPPPDPPDFGTKDKEYNDSIGYYPWCLAVTLSGTASVMLSQLAAKCRPKIPKQWGLVVGTRQMIHHLVTYVAQETPAIFESIPLPRDNRVFRDLLARAPDRRHDDPYDPHGLNRKLFTFGIGEWMGKFHNRWIFDEDAHEGNFFMSNEGVVPCDFAKACCAYRPLTALQAATTLLPLLSSFSRVDWYWFKRGYVIERGLAGLDVVELIDSAGD